MAAAVVGGWMLLAQLGVIDDPYPFPFLVFLSSLAQLVFMFLIMVGQDVLGEESDRRAIQTVDHTDGLAAHSLGGLYAPHLLRRPFRRRRGWSSWTPAAFVELPREVTRSERSLSV